MLREQEIIIIGSGLMGLSTAISLKEKNPHQSITLLERSLLPFGASTRNAGFACFGKACEMLSDIRLQGEKAAALLAYERYRGLELLRQRIGDAAMNYENLGGHELIFDSEENVKSSDLQLLNDLLEPYFKQRVFFENNDKIKQSGFAGVKQLISNPLEGQIHSGKLVSALWQMANKMGVRVITGAEVQHIQESAKHIEVEVRRADRDYVFTADKLAICTNALNQEFLKDQNLKPGRGQVLITEEIENLPLSGSFHFDEGYYYFRNVGKRILFGGGRNLAFEKEETTEFALNPVIQEKLDAFLNQVIYPKGNIRVEMRWCGIMGFSPDKTPLIKPLSPRKFIGLTCNGMGVALSSLSGEKLAGMIAD